MITPSSAGRSVLDPARRLQGARTFLCLHLALLGTIAAAVMGCAHGPVPVAQPVAPVTHLDMEPIHITASKGADGVEVESYDAADLFDQASKALADKRYDDAIATYGRLQKEFQDERYTRPALYNVGLAYQGKKDWNNALASFRALVDKYPDTADAKDAQFQMGATYAELEDWSSSLQMFAQILSRKDLTSDDRLEALARRGYAQVQTKDLDTAERTFTSAVVFFHQVEASERLETDFYLALSMYELGEISHERFRGIPLRLPEAQMDRDLDQKARLLLTAQRQYIDTIKLGNAQWASAAGYQIGSLYEELYDSFVHAPTPPELLRPEAAEKLEVYRDELRKKIRVLLEKSVKTHEANLLMMERLGVRNEWRDKSKLAYAKIQQLLDPSFRPEPEPASGAGPGSGAPSATPRGSETPPPIPTAPERPSERDENRGAPNRAPEGPTRQIL